jgi:hypothetical protein
VGLDNAACLTGPSTPSPSPVRLKTGNRSAEQVANHIKMEFQSSTFTFSLQDSCPYAPKSLLAGRKLAELPAGYLAKPRFVPPSPRRPHRREHPTHLYVPRVSAPPSPFNRLIGSWISCMPRPWLPIRSFMQTSHLQPYILLLFFSVHRQRVSLVLLHRAALWETKALPRPLHVMSRRSGCRRVRLAPRCIYFCPSHLS